jgi:hypothetical protein
MNQMSDLVNLKGFLQACQVGDISRHESDFTDFFFRQDEAQASGIFLEVKNPNLIAALQQMACDPSADTAVTAG